MVWCRHAVQFMRAIFFVSEMYALELKISNLGKQIFINIQRDRERDPERGNLAKERE